MPPRPFSAGFVLFLLWLHVSGSFAQRWSGGRTQWSALPSTALGGGPGDLEHNAGLGALLHPNWASDPGDTQLAHVSAPLVNLEGLHRPHGHPTLLDLSQFRQRHHNTAGEFSVVGLHLPAHRGQDASR